jgi:hypothetical protein
MTGIPEDSWNIGGAEFQKIAGISGDSWNSRR